MNENPASVEEEQLFAPKFTSTEFWAFPVNNAQQSMSVNVKGFLLFSISNAI